MRQELAYLLLILILAFGVRVYAPWNAVLGGPYVNFLETDAWYHIRLIENQVRNWPWRVTLDPYAAVGGQFVPIAPFFDSITATVVRVGYGANASISEIERIAAFVPPVLGTLAIAAVWSLARLVFDHRAALVAAALLAVAPGHFLDRTQLGFYDHHALEALLALTSLGTIALALRSPAAVGPAMAAGLSLGLYLLSWSSGAFLLAILGGWLVGVILLAGSTDQLARAGRVLAIASGVALAMVLVFQDRRMFRYESQLLGLLALGGTAFVVDVAARRVKATPAARLLAYAGAASVGLLVVVVVWASASGVLMQLITDLGRLTADPQRMGVLEARPLFLYTGQWSWGQPWVFFRATFYVGLLALILFTGRVVLERRPDDALIWVTTSAMFAATYGQNRFGYYLVPMCALLAGWLCTLLLDWRRDVALVAIGAGVFAPSLAPAALLQSRAGSLPEYWRGAMIWLRDRTEPPFSASAGHDDYYYARYGDTAPPPDYAILNWWDHGYWVVQLARRVPVSNPTQERAPNGARFFAATNEAEAVATLAAERARYVLADWELPFRFTSQGAIMGRFQNVIDWAGGRHDDYYEVMYRRVGGSWLPVWVFHEPYYRSMVFRLMVLGGAPSAPDLTSVIIVGDRVDATGMRFKEILAETNYPSYEAAVAAAAAPRQHERAIVVGLDPWRAAFPVERLTRLREVHAARTADQAASESPWVRVFRVTP